MLILVAFVDGNSMTPVTDIQSTRLVRCNECRILKTRAITTTNIS